MRLVGLLLLLLWACVCGEVLAEGSRRPWPSSILGKPGSGSVVFDFPIGCDFSGFFVEMMGLLVAVPEARFPTLESCSPSFVSSLAQDRALVTTAAASSTALRLAGVPLNAKVVVRLHSVGSACPKAPVRSLFVVRTMSEADQVPQSDLACFRSGHVDALFVPTSWHARLYRDAMKQGERARPLSLPPPPVYVVGETVNMKVFSPTKRERRFRAKRQLTLIARECDTHDTSFARVRRCAPPRARGKGDHFVVFSNSRFSRAKGVPQLLRAWWDAFAADRACKGGERISAASRVELRLRAYVPGWGPFDRRHRSARDALRAVAARYLDERCEDGGRGDVARLLEVVTLVPHLTRAELAREYHGAAAFALASGGEGWGLPPMEAIAAGVQTVIVTDAAAFSAEEHYVKRTGAAAAAAAAAAVANLTGDGKCPSTEECCAHVVAIPCEGRRDGFCLADVGALAEEIVAARARWERQAEQGCPPQCQACRLAARRALEDEFGSHALRSTLIDRLVDVVEGAETRRDEL